MSNVNYQGITMTIPYQTFETMKKQIDSLMVENQSLKKRPLSGKASSDVNDLRAALEAALPIVQFAVSNLNPESVLGWPHKQLASLGALLRSTTDDPHLLEMATTFYYQAEHAADVDVFRAKRLADAAALFPSAGDDDDEGVDTRPG